MGWECDEEEDKLALEVHNRIKAARGWKKKIGLIKEGLESPHVPVRGECTLIICFQMEPLAKTKKKRNELIDLATGMLEDKEFSVRCMALDTLITLEISGRKDLSEKLSKVYDGQEDGSEAANAAEALSFVGAEEKFEEMVDDFKEEKDIAKRGLARALTRFCRNGLSEKNREKLFELVVYVAAERDKEKVMVDLLRDSAKEYSRLAEETDAAKDFKLPNNLSKDEKFKRIKEMMDARKRIMDQGLSQEAVSFFAPFRHRIIKELRKLALNEKGLYAEVYCEKLNELGDYEIIPEILCSDRAVRDKKIMLGVFGDHAILEIHKALFQRKISEKDAQKILEDLELDRENGVVKQSPLPKDIKSIIRGISLAAEKKEKVKA